jgi:hypothetical protein
MKNRSQFPDSSRSDDLDSARLYPRFPLAGEEHCVVRINDMIGGKVEEIGIGGCGMISDQKDAGRLNLLKSENSIFRIRIDWYGRSHTLNARISHLSGQRAGICFLHDRSRDLPFLQEFIGPLSFGVEVARVESGQLQQQPVRNDGLHQGYISIRQSDSADQIEGVLIRYMRHKISFELRVTAEGVETSHDIGAAGELTEMHETFGVDPDIVRISLLMLHGFVGEIRTPLLIDAWEFAYGIAVGRTKA